MTRTAAIATRTKSFLRRRDAGPDARGWNLHDSKLLLAYVPPKQRVRGSIQACHAERKNSPVWRNVKCIASSRVAIGEPSGVVSRHHRGGRFRGSVESVVVKMLPLADAQVERRGVGGLGQCRGYQNQSNNCTAADWFDLTEKMHTQGCVILRVRWRWASTRMKVKRALVSKINRGSFCQACCVAPLIWCCPCVKG